MSTMLMGNLADRSVDTSRECYLQLYLMHTFDGDCDVSPLHRWTVRNLFSGRRGRSKRKDVGRGGRR